MPYQDLREYILRLEAEGEIQRIEPQVDWHLEVGAIIRRSYDLKAPAPFFQAIKGYPAGYRILGAPIGSSSSPQRFYARLAMALEMAPEASAADIIEEWVRRRGRLIKPKLLASGPCKEEVQLGEEVDLFRFPAPYLHEGDGGRYLGTWHTVITRDPDTGWVNWGMYRLMIHDRYTLGGLFSLNQHIGFHFYQKYEPRGKPMEFAVVFGGEPVTPLVSGIRIPPGMDEVDFIGGLRGEGVELVRCETVDLEVPATAEIVLEGEVLPQVRREEGPFGEYTGYRVGDRAPRPVLQVRAITHRHDPILPVSCMGVPVDDCAVIQPISRAAEILADLRERGFPVRMVYSPPESVGHLTVVSTQVPFPQYARHLANAIWGSPGWGRSAWYLIIVDDDVDVTSMQEVIWALTTRCHPQRGIFSQPAPGMPLLPFLSPYERSNYLGAYALFDCTWPKDWPPEAVPVKASFDVLWPKEIQERVLQNWQHYGYR